MNHHALQRCSVLGVNLAVTDYAGALAAVDAAVRARACLRVHFTNVHVTMVAQRDAALRAALNHPDALTLPDGMPLVWAMRALGCAIRTRVYGPDFFDQCLARSEATGHRHYFLGGTEETLRLLQETLRARFPRLDIAGAFSPPFRPLRAEETQAIADRINAGGADILWVGLGAPKQEKWIAEMAGRLSVPVCAAVGAAFDFHAGTVKQAPDWMQDRGLEWLYRLVQEPRRLWFRYGYYNPMFVLRFSWQWLRWRLRGRAARTAGSADRAAGR
ncbi:WecB/TagA/CpsF family glycosyltransferase [bacterium]|nr:WecB/TagA/CpsF family glycosyltransferase [bacterium]